MTDRMLLDLPARRAIGRGFDQIARLAQVTLGPIGGLVAVERPIRSKSPELLDDAATIARRVVALADPFEDMGARTARHMAWRLREEVGDGSATALVIAQSVLARSLKLIAAGHSPMPLWRGLQKGQSRLEARLESLAYPLEDPAQIAALATFIVRDPQIGRLIEEILDIVGPRGYVHVRDGYGRSSEREYLEGVYWEADWVSGYFADPDRPMQAHLERPYLLLTDQALQAAEDILPAMTAVRQADGRGLAVIADDIRGAALNLMVTNNAQGTLRLLGLKAPRLGLHRTAILEDIAILTGARLVRKDAGERPSHVRLEDLGQAQSVSCHRTAFNIAGGKGDPHAVRERIRALQGSRDRLDDRREREAVDERIGKLLGGTAILHVGGATQAEREQKRALAENAVQVVRSGLQGGVVAGGGSAYLAALPALDGLAVSEEEAPALDVLRQALTAPLYWLARNAGHDPGPVVARVRAAPPGWGFDVIHGQIVDMVAAHIVDPLPTARAALAYALSAATMALTTEVLIHRSHRDRTSTVEP